MSTSLGAGADVSGAIPACLLAYLRRAGGAELVDDVLAAAGVVGWNEKTLAQRSTWVRAREVEAVASAAAELLGDPAVGRGAGVEMFRSHRREGITEFFMAAGSPEAALDIVFGAASRMSSAWTVQRVALEAGRLVAEGRQTVAGGRHRFWCDVSVGYWSKVPELYGSEATVIHPQCQSRGHDRCRFVVSWNPEAVGAKADDSGRAAGAAQRRERMLGAFERLQGMAADLAAAEEVPAVLRAICEGAVNAVQTNRFVVAVRIGDRPRVHSTGLDVDTSEIIAEEILAGRTVTVPDLPVAVAPLATVRTSFGALAAVLPPGTSVNDVDRRLLTAFAEHASSALEAAVAREEAGLERDTAHALLALARELARLGTQAEMAERLGQAIPEVTRSQSGAVWLWDEAAGCVRLAALSAPGMDGPIEDVLTVEQVPDLAVLAASPRPLLLTVDGLPGNLRSRFDRWGAVFAAVVPITSHGTTIGFAAAGFDHEVAADACDELVTRMAGVADIAASAFDNARLLEQVNHQALHDPLTGLPNRPLIEDRALHALLRRQRHGGAVGLLFVDLDRFKAVNDSLGHAAGDDLLCQVAMRMRACVRAADTVARMGGDEFVVLLEEVEGIGDASAVAAKVLASLREPFVVEGSELWISCSIGVAVAPDHGEDYAALLQHADQAMYRAKAGGRNGFEVEPFAGDVEVDAVDPDGHVLIRRGGRRLAIESALHRALDGDELRVLYQPQIDLATMQVVAMEALVRWQHPELGLMAPSGFLDIAEESGLATEIDRWVLRAVLGQLSAWREADLPGMRAAVNLSAATLASAQLAGDIEKELVTAAVPPDQLDIEVSDRLVMADDTVGDRLCLLAELGVGVVIDDFGTGNSVEERLRALPVSTVKIDRRFVQEVRSRDHVPPVVKALLALAQACGLRTVAEGVELAAQAGLLRRLGCDRAQGYFFAPPAPPADAAVLVRGAIPR